MDHVTKRQLFEAALLIGMAYLNEHNKLNLTAWKDQITLPSIKEAEEYIKNSV